LKIMSLTSSKLCATLALMGLGASLATADSVINSFEILPLLNPPANNPPYTSVSQSTAAGVTDGTYSMEVVYGPAVSGQNWMYTAGPAGNNTYDAPTYMKWRTHKTFKLDVHRPALDFSPDQTGWNLEVYLAINKAAAAGGWSQYELLPWVWLDNGVSTNQTLSWDYSALVETAPITGTWLQLVLSAKSIYGGVYHGGTVYFDNARFADPVDIGFTFPTNSSGGSCTAGCRRAGARRPPQRIGIPRMRRPTPPPVP